MPTGDPDNISKLEFSRRSTFTAPLSFTGAFKEKKETGFYKLYKMIQNECPKIDRDPYFKPMVFSMRKVIYFYAEFFTSNLKPIYFSFGLSAIWFALFKQRFEFIGVEIYSTFELITISTLQIVWNIIACVLTNLKWYKMLTVLSKITTVLVFLYLVLFIVRWLLTAGTTYVIAIDGISLIFCIWNYIGFGMLALFYPIPIEVNNIFIILLTSNVTIFLWHMFPFMDLIFYSLVHTIWDLLTIFIPRLQPKPDDYKYGLYYTIMVDENELSFNPEKEGKGPSLSIIKISESGNRSILQKDSDVFGNAKHTGLEPERFQSLSIIKLGEMADHEKPRSKSKYRLSILDKNRITEDDLDNETDNNEDKPDIEGDVDPISKNKQLDANKSNKHESIVLNSLKSVSFNDFNYHLNLRKNSLGAIKNMEMEVGIEMEKAYGPVAIKKIEELCQKYVEEGFHQKIANIIFCNVLLTTCITFNTWSGLYMTLHLFGFIFLLKEMMKIFFNRRTPSNLLILLLFFISVATIRQMVTPNFINFIFSDNIPKKFIIDSLKTLHGF